MNPESWIPRTATGVRISKDNSDRSAVVVTTDSGRYFRLKNNFALVLDQIDGIRNLESIYESLQDLGFISLLEIIKELEDNRIIFLKNISDQGQNEEQGQVKTRKISHKLGRYVSDHFAMRGGLITWKLMDLGKFEQAMTVGIRVARLLRIQFVYWLTIISLPISLVSLRGSLGTDFSLAGKNSTVALGIEVAIGVIFSSVSHELAHVICLVYFKGRPRDFGVMSIYGNPGFYSDISDSWMMSRKQRILIALSGVSMNFFLCATCAWTLHFSVTPSWTSALTLLGAFNGVVGILNLYPFVRLDGYLALVAVTDISNLREKSINSLRQRVSDAITGRASREAVNYFFYIYALIAYVSPYALMIVGVGATRIFFKGPQGVLDLNLSKIIILFVFATLIGKIAIFIYQNIRLRSNATWKVEN